MSRRQYLLCFMGLGLAGAIAVVLWTRSGNQESDLDNSTPTEETSTTPLTLVGRGEAPTGATTAVADAAPGPHPFEGVVVDAEGKPVSGARVSVWRTRQELVAEARTDAMGRYAIPRLDRERVCLRVDAPGLLPAIAGVWHFGGQVRPLELVKGCPVRVTVTQGADGAPVAGARVRSICGEDVTGDQDFATHARYTDESVTDETGRAVVLAVPGITRTYITKVGYASVGTTPIHIAAVGADLSVELVPGRTFSGTVFDADGEPVVGALVRAKADPLYDRTRQTNDEGAFHFEEVPPPSSDGGGLTFLYASVRARGFAPYARRLDLGADDDGATMEARLSPARAIVGQALDKDGKPAANVLIHMNPDDLAWFSAERFGDPAAKAITDANGRFRLEPAARGKADLMAWWKDGTGRGFFGDAEVYVEDTDEPTSVEIREEDLGDGRARVLFLDPEGQPIDDGLIDVWRVSVPDDFVARESTNARGQVLIEGLPEDRLVFNGQAHGFADFRVEVDLSDNPERDVRIRLPKGEMTGSLRMADGTPAQVAVRLVRIQRNGDSDWCWPEVKTDAEGRFRFRGLGEDTYGIEPENLSAIGGPPTFRAGAENLTWTLVTEKEALRLRPRVRLRSRNGGSLEDASVRVDGLAEDCEWDEGDVYLLPQVAPSPCTVIVFVEGYREARLEGIVPHPGTEPIDLDVVLERGARLVGTIRDAKGTPIPYVDVRIGRHESWAEEDGTYELGGLDPGEHALEYSGSYLKAGTVMVKLNETGTTKHDISAEARGVLGIRTPKTLEFASEATVEAQRVDGAEKPVSSRFSPYHEPTSGIGAIAHLRGLRPGRYRLQVNWGGKTYDLGERDVTALDDAWVVFEPD